MVYIFIIPSILPSTSAVQKFYNSSFYKQSAKKNRLFPNPWNLNIENKFWKSTLWWAIGLAEEQLATFVSLQKTKICIEVSNIIFYHVINKYSTGTLPFHTVIKYFWNRIACQIGKPELSIDRVIIKDNFNFKPIITKSKVYGEELKTLIISSRYVKIPNYLQLIRTLFYYINDPNHRCIYGRVLKKCFTNNREGIDNCFSDDSDEYSSIGCYEYDKDEKYHIQRIDRFDLIRNYSPKTKCSFISEKERKTIESLSPDKLQEVYPLLIEMVSKEQ